tara:strand:- start:543 stop:683 length:141 start_codon:yes stop_codon:yes gene_type:complete
MRRYRWILKSYFVIALLDGFKTYSPKLVNKIDNFLENLNKKNNNTK